MTARLGSRITFADIHPEDVTKRYVEQMRVIARTGHIWSMAPRPSTVWVIPTDGRDKHVEVRLPPARDINTLPRRIDGPVEIPWHRCNQYAVKPLETNA